jgi:hypothetical protein
MAWLRNGSSEPELAILDCQPRNFRGAVLQWALALSMHWNEDPVYGCEVGA